MRYFTFLGNLFPQFLICCLLLILNFNQGFKVGCLWFFGYALNLLIKNTVKKTRPNQNQWRVPNVKGYSFPSGHSLTSLALYWSIAKYFPLSFPLSLFFYLMPFALGLSRLYLRVHFIEDVLGGWLIAYIYLQLAEDSVLKICENILKWGIAIIH